MEEITYGLIKKLLRKNGLSSWGATELLSWVKGYEYQLNVEGDNIALEDMQQDWVEIENFTSKEFIEYWEDTLRNKFESDIEVWGKNIRAQKLLEELQGAL